jgi:thioredoxin-like negative regulator of GroEL
MMLEVTIKNFESEVLQSQLPVLVLWGSVMDVNSNKIALQMMKLDATKVKAVRVDIDKSPDLVMRYTVRDVPLVVLFEQGMALAQDTTLSDVLLKQVA